MNAKNWFGIIFRTKDHIVLQMDAALGEAGAARTVQPERAIVFARLGSLQVR